MTRSGRNDPNPHKTSVASKNESKRERQWMKLVKCENVCYLRCVIKHVYLYKGLQLRSGLLCVYEVSSGLCYSTEPERREEHLQETGYGRHPSHLKQHAKTSAYIHVHLQQHTHRCKLTSADISKRPPPRQWDCERILDPCVSAVTASYCPWTARCPICHHSSTHTEFLQLHRVNVRDALEQKCWFHNNAPI